MDIGHELVLPEGTEESKLVIAPGVRVGDFLYLSGNVGLDSAKGELAGDDIESQARQALRGTRCSRSTATWYTPRGITRGGTRCGKRLSQ